VAGEQAGAGEVAGVGGQAGAGEVAGVGGQAGASEVAARRQAGWDGRADRPGARTDGPFG
jgi:streptogrisin D